MLNLMLAMVMPEMFVVESEFSFTVSVRDSSDLMVSMMMMVVVVMVVMMVVHTQILKSYIL